MPIYLHKLSLSHFRNYEALRLDLAGTPVVVLTGENGSGKTNVLEAISLLTPGRGLRGGDLLDMKNRQSLPRDVWAVSAEVETAAGMVKIGTGLARNEHDLNEKRRVVRINGRDARNQNELANILSAVWLTPQMDRLFSEGASGRRKFFDRLVYALEPDHAARLNRYDKNLRERMKLLQAETRADEAWLDSLELQIAGDAVAIAASRAALLERMAAAAQALEARESLFPSPRLSLSGWAENQIVLRKALEVEDEMRLRFHKSRDADRLSGRSHEGAHRSDLIAFYGAKDMPASQCSTGEQKALLVAVTLAHARLMQAETGHMPLLLLDEVCAHLDDARRAQLFGFFQDMKGQVFLTGTEAAAFAGLGPQTLFLEAAQGRVFPQRKLQAV